MLECIVLGCSGGPFENNLSSYLVGSDEYIALDCGTLLSGMKEAIKTDDLAAFFKKKVKGYLLSHPHLDHILGLVINAQVDSKKPILGRDATIDALRDCIFNGRIWPNCGNEGEGALNLYTYVRLPFGQRIEVPGTSFFVEAYPLIHSTNCESTAFLLENKGEYLLYFGDVASDRVTGSKECETVWKRVAPLVREKKLKGIFLECSYVKDYKGGGATSHLNTALIIEELKTLSSEAGSLQGLKVVVTHRKESLNPNEDLLQKIEQEIIAQNRLGIEFIFPVQGEKIVF